MPLTPRDIHQAQFHDSWRGYNQEEVDDFLDRVAEELDRVQRENQSLQGRLRELDRAVSSSRHTEDMLKKTLLNAQQAAEEAIGTAKAKAQQMIAEAEARARRAGEEARERLASVEREQRERASAAERDLTERRKDLEGSIERLRAFEGEIKQRLKTFLEHQLRAVATLGDSSPSPLSESAPSTESARPPATASAARPSDAQSPSARAAEGGARPRSGTQGASEGAARSDASVRAEGGSRGERPIARAAREKPSQVRPEATSRSPAAAEIASALGLRDADDEDSDVEEDLPEETRGSGRGDLHARRGVRGLFRRDDA